MNQRNRTKEKSGDIYFRYCRKKTNALHFPRNLSPHTTSGEIFGGGGKGGRERLVALTWIELWLGTPKPITLMN
jgi:hypothetical protein